MYVLDFSGTAEIRWANSEECRTSDESQDLAKNFDTVRYFVPLREKGLLRRAELFLAMRTLGEPFIILRVQRIEDSRKF